jgi:hypothetical protein
MEGVLSESSWVAEVHVYAPGGTEINGQTRQSYPAPLFRYRTRAPEELGTSGAGCAEKLPEVHTGQLELGDA